MITCWMLRLAELRWQSVDAAKPACDCTGAAADRVPTVERMTAIARQGTRNCVSAWPKFVVNLLLIEMTSLLKERFFFSRSTVPIAQAMHNPVPFVIPSFRFLGLQDRAARGTSNGQGILVEPFSAVVDASKRVDDGDRCTSSLFLGWRAARTVEGRAEHAASGTCCIDNLSQLYHSQDCRSIALSFKSLPRRGGHSRFRRVSPQAGSSIRAADCQ